MRARESEITPGGTANSSVGQSDIARDALLPGREFAYAKADFDRVRKLIYQHAGISLNDSKTEMVYSRLAKRLRQVGARSFGDYLGILDDDEHPEWQEFVNALTTNLTEFFREPHHYPILAAHAKTSAVKPYRVWSAACSTGEEPYSLAITLCEAFESLEPQVSIVATDLDTAVLTRACEGIYAADRIEGIESERLRRFFLKGKGARQGSARVRASVRALVTFRQLNFLAAQWDLAGPFDAIFCRNVLIYFDKPTQRRVLGRLAERLAPDGLLFAGHSESLLHASDVFQPIGKTVYRRADWKPARHG